MPIRTKYREAIDLLEELKAKEIKTWEEDGDLKLSAILKTEHERNLVVDKIKELNYMEATDIEYHFKVEGEE